MKTIRIAVIADIHHGADVMTKKSSAALDLFGRFAAFVAAEQPDLVIDLGDRISDRDHDADLALERDVAAAFRSIDVPCHHLCGNHDRDFISVAENEQILGKTLAHEAIDIGNWRLLLWRADTRIRRLPTGSHFELGEGDLAWLAGQLAATGRPTLLVSHVPLSSQSMAGNYYFQNNLGVATYPGVAEVQALLRRTTVPLVCLAGHVHWNSVTFLDGIPHVTLQSLTETFTTAPHAAEAWGMIELGDEIGWTALGRQRFSFAVDTASTAQRWPEPHPPFKPRV